MYMGGLKTAKICRNTPDPHSHGARPPFQTFWPDNGKFLRKFGEMNDEYVMNRSKFV